MNGPPSYFEDIRRNAARRWEQLEGDPELAGPWHLLFKQVQSPRHVLSELLQNADDAGATEASVTISDQYFVFEHDGEDFAEEHFASICRFAYSNKRALHTIGFRGVGFKSTFSLGDEVELFTPSLCIGFHRGRFTEPKWLDKREDTRGRTRVRVRISDSRRQQEVERNLEEWVASPVSLLFFKNIRRIIIGDREIHWGSLGPGPVHGSEWMALHKNEDKAYLLVRSEAEPFPPDALAEIKQERMLGVQEDIEFPPCSVEIVMGAKGRLYVVLPTGVETDLPFACNAPFIQDPARLKIKDPEISPTNRWLLDRAGRLAASAMLQWLNQAEMSVVDRALAYGLFPDVDRTNSSLEGTCGTLVEEAFDDSVGGAKLLLTEDGQLAQANQCVIVPEAIQEIWPPERAATLIDEHLRPPLSHHVETADRKKLVHRRVVEEITKQQMLVVLQQNHLPMPDSWRQLLRLWSYVAPEITRYRPYVRAKDVRIVPVQGQDVLHSSSEVVRIGEKKMLQSEDDWVFLAKHLVVLHQYWPRFLAEKRKLATESNLSAVRDMVDDAYGVLSKIGMDDTSDVSKVIEQVAAEYFSKENIDLHEAVRLAQIAAKLGAGIGDSFRYARRDERYRNSDIIYDSDGTLEVLVPETQRATRMLHPSYSTDFTSCTQDEWVRWIASGASRLLPFAPLEMERSEVFGRKDIEKEARRRGLQGELRFQYVTHRFFIEDWDFPDHYWRHWLALADEDERVWVNIAERILEIGEAFWRRTKAARILQVATTGSTQAVTSEPLLPSWVLRLREHPCLRDTHGIARKPGDLLRRTPETESLMDVEPFVHARLDGETTRELLDYLGVRSTPTGPDRLLGCLRSLAEAETPPVHEVEKWYRRLDQMIDVCSTGDMALIREAFRGEKLILAQDGTWMTASGVFQSSHDDVPDAAVVMPTVSTLTLWRKVGVAERPTADLAIEWLMGLPSGEPPIPEDLRRVRGVLGRHPVRIWEECRHWLNLAGEWVPVDKLAYGLSMQSLIPWGHLHRWVKQKTADLRDLSVELLGNMPFSGISLLSHQIDEQLQNDPMASGRSGKWEWLAAVGATLRWIELDDEEETQYVRMLAEVLAKTQWVEASNLDIIPYIEGIPAGTARQADVLWLGENLYTEPLPKAKLARRVPEEIGKAFSRADIKVALHYSFERSPEDVREYLLENFEIQPAPIEEPEPTTHSDAEQELIAETQPGTVQEADLEGVMSPWEADSGAPNDDPGETGTDIAPDDDEADAIMDEDPEEQSPSPPAPLKPAKPSILERFALGMGFRKDNEKRFYHENGSWIGKTNGNSFPWELRTADGALVRHFWPKDHCLDRAPLQLEADIWGLIDQHPDTHSLVLADVQGNPTEITGARLRAMREEGSITLYPASYRLVYDND